jgi:hypothetical protein
VGERLKKSFRKGKQVSIREMNESKSTDEVTKSHKLQAKALLCEGSVTSTAGNLFTGCVPAVIEAT